MRRRDFLRRSAAFSAAGLLVPSFLRRGCLLNPEQAWAGPNDPLAGQILVNVILSGGNDGINTVVPYLDPQYPVVRPTLALDPGVVHPIAPGTGLHPSLGNLVPWFESGDMAVVQGVGYPEMNLSHFRGTDIWFSGSSGEDTVETGWLARFLEATYPEFPTLAPPMPYALQQSLAHRIPLLGNRGQTGVVVDNPDTFYSLVNANYSGEWDDELPGTLGGDELGFMRTVDREAFEYAEAIQTAASAGTNTVAYPGTTLGFQLEIVARLISGGLGTPIYLTAEYGFDTHASQAGSHSALLSSVGSSIAAFLADLTNQGLEEKVVVMTQSEFGRRVQENGSLGTDHGSMAPMLLVGKRVNGGIYGTEPDRPRSLWEPAAPERLPHRLRQPSEAALRKQRNGGAGCTLRGPWHAPSLRDSHGSGEP